MTVPRAITAAQRVVAKTFTATATVMRRTQVADTSGGFSDTYAALATHSCSFSEEIVSPVERERDVRIQSISYWKFVFAAGTDIRLTDRLVVGARTFEVSGAGEGSLAVVLRVYAQEIV